MPAALAPTLIEARGARKASEAQERQGERGIGLIEEQFGKTEEALSPFIRGETPEQCFARHWKPRQQGNGTKS